MTYLRSLEFRFGLHLALIVGSIVCGIDLLVAAVHSELSLGAGAAIVLSALVLVLVLIALDAVVIPWAVFRSLPKPMLTAQVAASLIVGFWLWLMTKSPATGPTANIPSIGWLHSLENNLLLGWLISALALGLLGRVLRQSQR